MAEKPTMRVVPMPVKPAPAAPPQPFKDVTDFLQQMIADIAAGKLAPNKMFLFYATEVGDGSGAMVPGLWVYNVTPPEQIAYAEICKDTAVRTWRQEVVE